MIYVTIDYNDGIYSLMEVSEGSVAGLQAAGIKVHGMSKSVYNAYCAHLDQCQVWHDLIRRMANSEST